MDLIQLLVSFALISSVQPKTIHQEPEDVSQMHRRHFHMGGRRPRCMTYDAGSKEWQVCVTDARLFIHKNGHSYQTAIHDLDDFAISPSQKYIAAWSGSQVIRLNESLVTKNSFVLDESNLDDNGELDGQLSIDDSGFVTLRPALSSQLTLQLRELKQHYGRFLESEHAACKRPR